MPSLNFKLAPLQSLIDSGDITYANEYAEPGYQPEHDNGMIFFGNWNPKEFYFSDEDKARFNALPRAIRNHILGMARIANYIEKVLQGECEWSDEWETCSVCEGAVRRTGDSYTWQRFYIEVDYQGIVCLKCAKTTPDETIDWYVEQAQSREQQCLTHFDDEWQAILEERNFVQVNEDRMENGWYGGQSDDPRVITKNLLAAGVDRFLYVLDYVQQFDLGFNVWADKGQLEAAKAVFEAGQTKAKEDPAEILKRGLQNAAAIMDQPLDGEGVKVVKILADGSAEAKIVSNEDFIAGKALD
jgi:hypothetical protein